MEQVKPWRYLGDIGWAIQDYAIQNGYSIVCEIGGHGIGLKSHQDPWGGHISKRGTGMLIVPNMVFTIEPMVNMGSDEITIDQRDGWTVYTTDGKPSTR